MAETDELPPAAKAAVTGDGNEEVESALSSSSSGAVSASPAAPPSRVSTSTPVSVPHTGIVPTALSVNGSYSPVPSTLGSSSSNVILSTPLSGRIVASGNIAVNPSTLTGHSTSVITSLALSSVFNTSVITTLASTYASVQNTSVITSTAPNCVPTVVTPSLTSNSAAIAHSVPSGSKSGKGSSGKKANSLAGKEVSGQPASAGQSSSASASVVGDGASEPAAADADAAGNSSHKLLQAVRSTSLPFPLPVPTYSQAVQAARASGNVLAERATIIRETVKFFLSLKYWWTTEDYDRIAELVVNEFPELRDPVVWPTTPCYGKVRLDLSMCARNIRRIAKNQEKRRGSPGHSGGESSEAAASAPVEPPPPPKPSKGSGKSRRKSSTLSLSAPTMVTLPSAGQMLPHTAHTAHTTLPTTSTVQEQKETVSLPYMLTSTPTVSTTSTVLPPVAHFLGHPSGHSHSPGGIVFPSLLPATHSVSTAETSAAVSLSSAAASGRGSHEMVEGSLSVGGESGGGGSARHDSLTNSSSSSSLITAWHPDAQLPERLPVPPYSEKVMKAKKTGVTKYERPLIIRETVLFFLSIKYWWSSVDYDRISDFVVEYFPDLKDPMLSPNMPPNRRVRADLSQTARNIRRREMKIRRDSRSPEDRFSAVGTVTLPVYSSQQPSTDFCNELLTAASIIESRTAALNQKDVAKALETHPELSREADGGTGVITHTQTAKNSKPEPGGGKATGGDLSVSKEQGLVSVKYPYTAASVAEVAEAGLVSSDVPVPNTQLAVIKQEAGEEEQSSVDQYQVLQAQAQASQAWFSAQISQALSMQALTGLTGLSAAHVSQAFSPAQISEQLLSVQDPPRSSTNQITTPPAAHQSTSTNGNSGSGSLPSQSQASVQHLTQASAYSLPISAPLSDSGLSESTHVDRMSAMAMWRSTCLPDPLPVPPYSLNVLRARDSGNTSSARPRIIRETTQFFLCMKMWWTTQDYERIAEMVLREFPDLKSVQNIKKDLGTCARNMRRRLPMSRNKQWAGYQSPPHSVLKEGEGVGDGGSLTLGELATMASLREAQDKGRVEASGLSVFTEEQRQALLAHSVYEQNSLAWNTLYQQQLSAPAESTAILPQSRGAKRSLSDTSGSKGIELVEKEFAEALKQAALQSAKHLGESDSSRRHSVEVSEGLKTREMKQESATKARPRIDVPKIESYPVMKELISHPALSAREPKKLTTEPAAYHVPQVPVPVPVPHISSLAEGVVHTHPTPAHSQPGSQVRCETNSTEEEVPMNLTCTTSAETPKPAKAPKQVKSEPKASKKAASAMDSFSAREQVWFPHGSPWKKSGQNMFKALPSPLPAPKYSQKLEKAREEGLAYRHRSEIIRETARFFLGFKYWWSSADYSRISELVVSEFPELKDPVAQPGQPCYRRVQRDLSMCARNLRRKNSRRQQLSTGETILSAAPKKLKSNGPKEKKPKKEANIKVEAAGDATDVRTGGSTTAMLTPISHIVSTAAATLPSTPSLTQALYQAGMDPVAVPSLSSIATLPSHSDEHAVQSSQWSAVPGLANLHSSTGSVVVPPLLPSSVSSAALPTSVLVSTAAVTQHKQPVSSDRALWPATDTTSSVKSSHGTGSKKKSSVANSHAKAVSGSAHSKNVKPVTPTAHAYRQHGEDAVAKPTSHSREGEGVGRGGVLSSGGSQAAGVVKNKERGPGGQLASRPGHSEARALSNTTAIVTPTLSEARTSDSRQTESGVSDKVYINPEHGSELQAQLSKLWQESKFFDASLEVDNFRLPAHKLVLLAASPYLQSTFRHANPTSHLEVNLPRDTGVGAAKDFLKYIYQGVLHVSPTTVNALRRIAAMLQIDQLLTYCDDYIQQLSAPAPPTLSRHSVVPQTSTQVPRVSVNLRDATHGRPVASDRSAVAESHQTLEYSNAHTSLAVTGDHYAQQQQQQQQQQPASSRKRSVVSSVVDQFAAYTTAEGVGDHDRNLAVISKQEELHSGSVYSKRFRLSTEAVSEDALTRQVVSPQGNVACDRAAEVQQPPSSQPHPQTFQPSALVQHLTSDMVSAQPHTSSVIQHGPSIISGPGQVQAQVSSDQLTLSEQEAVVRFLSSRSDISQQLGEDNVSVTLLPRTDISMETGEEMQVSSEQTIHLMGEEAQVVSQHILAGEEGVVISAHAVQEYTGEEGQLLAEGQVISEAAVQEYQGEDGQPLTEQAIQDYQGQQEVVLEDSVQEYASEEGQIILEQAPQDFQGEEGQVVEEVVVESGDLLQDVEVAACETVECSLLPQTYCSSPEDAQALSAADADVGVDPDPDPDAALKTMASQWVAQQYAETPLDAATAQQFAAVLQERMYGGRGSSPGTQPQQDVGYENSQVYVQQVDADMVYISQATGQELVVETSSANGGVAVDSPGSSGGGGDAGGGGDGQEGQTSVLLPQTYCSSPTPPPPQQSPPPPSSSSSS